MKKDNEIAGKGNSLSTHFRQYDPRLVRWTSVDPLAGQFSHQSPYVGFDNNPIYYADPSGAASETTTKSKGKSSASVGGPPEWLRKTVEFIKHPFNKSKRSKYTTGSSIDWNRIGDAFRNVYNAVKNLTYRVFKGQKYNRSNQVDRGHWEKGEWVTQTVVVNGSQSLNFNLNVAGNERLTNLSVQVDRGTNPFNNFNYTTVTGFRNGRNRFGTVFGNPRLLSTTILPNLNGRFVSYTGAGLIPGANLALRVLNSPIFNQVFTSVGLREQWAGIVSSIMMSSRINPAFRKTSLLNVNVRTRGQVTVTVRYRKKILVPD